MTRPDTAWLEWSYDTYPRIEEEFQAALDESLQPRGPDALYDLVATFDLPAGAYAVDVGCGEGRHTVELARRFGFRVLGIDPVQRHIELATDEVAKAGPALPVELQQGTADALPVPDGGVDLIWCRDVLSHVSDLSTAYNEFRRAIRPGGRALIYAMFATPLLEPRERDWLLDTMGVVPTSADPAVTEAAVAAAGLRIDECVVLGGEWGELAQEQAGSGGRRLLHAARLLRDPERYVARFGAEAYDLMLGDCLWHIYAMIGKLERRAYLLTRD